jgi:DNA-binding PadR family transcriptional regulator
MKYVILKLLNEKPMHGYEVMKALEDRLRGCYSPSPGTVYPTLQWLEDESLVKSRDVEGKKVYEITDAGRKFLREHRDIIEEIFDRVKEALDETLGGGMDEVNRSVGRLVKEVYRRAWRAEDQAERKRILDVLKRATQELENLSSAREA